ncbi:hypothetical protein [Actinomadura verrucosospora]|uniref:DUF1877 family protein n=1 Tax=Actinomadura verrucosospora TaxID=46165 RepID=A0A7D3VZI2_ACTVE|nr:hypothetical protein [Actinomadura verrucosospora]QKG22632.1 hypothetical protein ACTIVE_4273 [Actinomadura verrucosospora]
MGVENDYFRAPDAAAVVRALEETDTGPLVGVADPVFDGISTKGVDPAVVFGQLIAIIKSVPWSVDIVASTMVWPTSPMPGPEGPEDDDDPWATGPWVEEFSDSVRDILASVPDPDVQDAVVAWSQTDELRGTSPDDLRPLADVLIELARQARDAGEHLYCWTCL